MGSYTPRKHRNTMYKAFKVAPTVIIALGLVMMVPFIANLSRLPPNAAALRQDSASNCPDPPECPKCQECAQCQECTKCQECPTTTATTATTTAHTKPFNVDEHDVDIVITWVNGTDPVWRESYISIFGAEKLRDLAERFVDFGEIFMLLASIEAYVPWVRQIFILTHNQQFDTSMFADDLRNKIRFVDHKDIMPASALPNFNSFAIESLLHKIPDLAEDYIYLNDDMVFRFPLEKKEAFDLEQGKFRLFATSMEPEWLFNVSKPDAEGIVDGHQLGIRNAAMLVKSKFRLVTFAAWHGGQFMNKASSAAAWDYFHDKLNKSLHHQYRVELPIEEGGDVQFPYLARAIALIFRHQVLNEDYGITLAEDYSPTYSEKQRADMFLVLQYVARYTGLERIEFCTNMLNDLHVGIKPERHDCFCSEDGFGVRCL